MTDEILNDRDANNIYDMGGYNAILSIEYALAEEVGNTISLPEVRAMLKATKEFIVSEAASEGRDLSEYLVPLDDVDRVIEENDA